MALSAVLGVVTSSQPVRTPTLHERGRESSARGRGITASVLLGVVLAACSGGAAAPAIAGGDDALPPALQAWAAFPVHASPRPIVLTGGTADGPRGVYNNEETKLALICGDFDRAAQLPTGPATAGGFRLINASKAFATLQPQDRTGSCATPRTPLTLTEAHLGRATYSTDRGPRTLPAWLFSLTGVEGPIAVLALAPEEEWFPPSLKPGASHDIGVGVGSDHRTLTVTFLGAQFETGPCGVRYEVKLTESPTAVMVTRISYANSHKDSTVACTLVGVLRHASAVLKAPLGARGLVDDLGYPMGANGNP